LTSSVDVAILCLYNVWTTAVGSSAGHRAGTGRNAPRSLLRPDPARINEGGLDEDVARVSAVRVALVVESIAADDARGQTGDLVEVTTAAGSFTALLKAVEAAG
jgi:hypothetical protein